MIKKKNVVISFDLDYTLINNRKGIVNSFNYALRKFGLPEVNKTTIQRMIGLPLNEMFTRFTDINPSELAYTFREYYANKGIYQSRLLSGVKNTLKKLKAQDFTLGVITSKKQNIAIKIVEYLEIDKFFDFILGESKHVRSKLDTSLIKYLFETYPNYKFIIIGDHPKDAMLAKELDCSFIGVLTGFHTKHQLEEARAHKKKTLIVKKAKEISIEIINSALQNFHPEN